MERPLGKLGEPFDPVVESLLRYPTDSPQFEDAAAVATKVDLWEALRQLRRTRVAFTHRQIQIYDRLNKLALKHPELGEPGSV